MQLVIKVMISLGIILLATGLGKRFPTLAGLISVMPLTGVIVLVFLYLENRGDRQVMEAYTRGAVWGILPTILFFAAAYLCFRREMPLAAVLGAGFGVWIVGALTHQYLLR